MTTSRKQAEMQVKRWLHEVVIGLNLCPFAAKPNRDQSIDFVVSEAKDEDVLLQDLQQQLQHLQDTPVEELETTLVIVPDFLQDFDDYNQFLSWVDQLLSRGGWNGVIQVASFHPDYCFADTDPNDAENLTNRAPYPIFHLIREDSLESVLQRFPDSDKIPEANIERMNQLSAEEKLALFPYLFSQD